MLYVQYENINRADFVGVKKKILAQCEAFKKKFAMAYYTFIAGQVIYLLDGNEVIDKEYVMTRKECNETIIQWLCKYGMNSVYIRYAFSDNWFIDFLIRLKEMKIKCVIEFPTIPYDGEGGNKRPIEDKYYREELHKYVDCCTTYANYETVFNIPCIPLVNGVEIEDHHRKKYRIKDGSIALVAVSTLANWHGYERVIQGLHEYYSIGGETKIIFHIVGKGGQLQYYNRLVEEWYLGGHVIFHGQLDGEQLDAIYDYSDIAMGSLGLYKTGIQSAAPIKLREYCARGIPFVYGYDDISFRNKQYFAYQVPNDESAINMQEMIDFYETIYDGRDFMADMRNYALNNLTWEKILQPVIEYLQ